MKLPRAAIITASVASALFLAFQLGLMQFGRDQGIYAVVADPAKANVPYDWLLDKEPKMRRHLGRKKSEDGETPYRTAAE